MPTRSILVAGTALVLLAAGPAARAQLSFSEDFTTTTYRDSAATTADWNTAAGELRMFPFQIENVGSYDTAGSPKDIEVSGNLAYVADPPNLAMLDITDPAAPALLGSLNIGSVTGIDQEGDLVYVSSGSNGLRVIDVTDPTAPVQIGIVATTGYANDVVVQGTYAYVAGGVGGGLVVVDISDPALPVQVGMYDTPNVAGAVDIDGTHCFVVDGSGSGILIVDVADPAAPALLGSILLSGDTQSIVVDGDLAYVGDAAAGLAVLDVSDPANPSVLGTLDPGSGRGLAVSGNTIYLAGFSFFHAIDVSDPTAPTLIESWDNPGELSAVAVDGEHAFLAAGTAGGVQVLKVRNAIYEPVLIGTLPLTDPKDIVVAGDRAYVAGVFDFVVLDVSDPANPAVLASLAGAGGRHVAVSGNLAFVSASGSFFRVVDIGDPSSPVVLGTLALFPGRLHVHGDLVYVAGASFAARVDVSDPTSPTYVGSAGGRDDIEVVGDLAYMGDVSGLLIRRLSSNTNVGAVSVGGGGLNGLTVAGDHVYLTKATGGLTVVDASNPAIPTIVEFYDSGYSGSDVFVSGDLALMVSGSPSPKFDVSDPTSLIQSGTLTDVPLSSIRIVGDHVYALAGSGQLLVFELYQRHVLPAGHRGQSLSLHPGPVARFRFTTVQTSGVEWSWMASGGWSPFDPDGSWHSLVGPALHWRTEHRPAVGTDNPSVAQLDVEWLLEPCLVDAIEDVPGDQGGSIRVNFTRSGYDFADEPATPATGYQIYQRVDPATAAHVQAEGRPEPLARLEGWPSSHARALGDRRFVIGGAGRGAGSFPPGTWEIVGWVAATQADSYMARVSTVADSSAGGPAWSVHLVTTHTTTPSVWFVSEPDSGYSVDNLAPAPPANLAAAYNTGSGNSLTWDAAPEPDFAVHSIYRSPDPDFVPTPADLVAQTSSPQWIDPDFDGGSVYYRVTTLDHAGNESDPSGPDVVTAVPVLSGPDRFALHPGSPNPFRAGTDIRFDVPQEGERIRLEVYDVSGRRVRALIDGQVAAGRQTVRWDGRDDTGRLVASGVYFCRMESDSFRRSRRLVRLN